LRACIIRFPCQTRAFSSSFFSESGEGAAAGTMSKRGNFRSSPRLRLLLCSVCSPSSHSQRCRNEVVAFPSSVFFCYRWICFSLPFSFSRSAPFHSLSKMLKRGNLFSVFYYVSVYSLSPVSPRMRLFFLRFSVLFSSAMSNEVTYLHLMLFRFICFFCILRKVQPAVFLFLSYTFAYFNIFLFL
jgi:hypothetical protein